MSAPDVSFIIPVWRPREDWLLQAVHSALDQPGAATEVVVVDDGNPDPIEDLLAGVRDPRLRLVRVPHGGVGAARNAGIAEASGRHVRFIDADDVAERFSSARLLALAGPATLAYGATAICDEQLRVRWVMRARHQGWADEDGLLARFPMRMQSLLIPRPVLERVGPWDEQLRVSEDWDFIQRALELAPVHGEREIATYYRRHAGSASSDVAAGREGARTVVERYFERHPERRATGFERRARAMLDAHAARVAVSNGRIARGAWLAARSGLRDPRAPAAQVRQAVPALRAAARRRLAG